MVDALAPFVAEFGVSADRSVRDAWIAAAAAAERGAEATASLVSRKGRAAVHGDRSRGTADPGAVSMAVALTAASEAWCARGMTNDDHVQVGVGCPRWKGEGSRTWYVILACERCAIGEIEVHRDGLRTGRKETNDEWFSVVGDAGQDGQIVDGKADGWNHGVDGDVQIVGGVGVLLTARDQDVVQQVSQCRRSDDISDRDACLATYAFVRPAWAFSCRIELRPS